MNPLLVPELFYHILDFLPASFSKIYEERRALCALAQTCSAFSEPCLDRLWRSLNSLLPLIQSYAGVVDEDVVKVPPSPEQWLVINRYLPRIRELTLWREDLSLCFLKCTCLILPNLRVLRWHRPFGSTKFTEEEVVSLSHIWPLLTPNIVTLELDMFALLEPESEVFLQNYFLLCPNLKSFKLDIFPGGIPPTSAYIISRAICNRGDWKCVALYCDIDSVALRHLALSSTLEVVSLTLNQSDEVFFGPTEIPFRNVKRLALETWDHCFDVATDLLRNRDQAFRAVEVMLETHQPVQIDIAPFFTAVVSPQRILSLESLVVSGDPHLQHHVPKDGIPVLSYDTFRPITSLIHLRKLVVNVELPFSVDDDEFADMVRSWPRLEVFWWQSMRGESTIGINSLFSLLVHCPRLCEIGLFMDMRKIPSPDDVVELAADVCRSPVIHLSIPWSESDGIKAVEACMHKCLPNTRWVCIRY